MPTHMFISVRFGRSRRGKRADRLCYWWCAPRKESNPYQAVVLRLNMNTKSKVSQENDKFVSICAGGWVATLFLVVLSVLLFLVSSRCPSHLLLRQGGTTVISPSLSPRYGRGGTSPSASSSRVFLWGHFASSLVSRTASHPLRVLSNSSFVRPKSGCPDSLAV